jgi:hypothetical protein
MALQSGRINLLRCRKRVTSYFPYLDFRSWIYLLTDLDKRSHGSFQCLTLQWVLMRRFGILDSKQTSQTRALYAVVESDDAEDTWIKSREMLKSCVVFPYTLSDCST